MSKLLELKEKLKLSPCLAQQSNITWSVWPSCSVISFDFWCWTENMVLCPPNHSRKFYAFAGSATFKRSSEFLMRYLI